MNINKKIEQIRQQPEHVRLKYVWFFVAICMLVIIIVWIISTKAAFQKGDVSQNFNQLKQSFDSDNIQMPSISDLPKTEGVLEQQNYSVTDEQPLQPSPSLQTDDFTQETDEQVNFSNSPTKTTPDSPTPKEVAPTFPTE